METDQLHHSHVFILMFHVLIIPSNTMRITSSKPFSLSLFSLPLHNMVVVVHGDVHPQFVYAFHHTNHTQIKHNGASLVQPPTTKKEKVIIIVFDGKMST